MTTRGPIAAPAGDSADTSIYVEEEGAYVCLSMQFTDGQENRSESVMLTPDLAEQLALTLQASAKDARSFTG